jgi:hypothetical protein
MGTRTEEKARVEESRGWRRHDVTTIWQFLLRQAKDLSTHSCPDSFRSNSDQSSSADSTSRTRRANQLEGPHQSESMRLESAGEGATANEQRQPGTEFGPRGTPKK